MPVGQVPRIPALHHAGRLKYYTSGIFCRNLKARPGLNEKDFPL
jgi:hypothetical protein